MYKIDQIINIFWFRRDLRLEDNVGLFHALKSGVPVLPVFIFDSEILSKLEDKNDRRVDFIHQALQTLKNQLESFGSTLLISNGKPTDIFKQLISEYRLQTVYTNEDYEPYARKRDVEVSKILESEQVQFKAFKDQVIFHPNEVLKQDGNPYTVFTPYSKVWKSKLSAELYKTYSTHSFWNNFLKTGAFEFPLLSSVGFQKTDIKFVVPHVNEIVVADYHSTRDLPFLEGTTRLSVHLRFGTISIRQLVALAIKLNETWLNELIWREFFMAILYHFPYVENNSFRKKYDSIQWRNNENEFVKWCEGKTGFPIVDAGMRQLNETGWMHNRVRMITASFLTKHLLIDWKWGEAYFASKLLDFDLSANNGNWQWAVGSGCDAAPYFRVFNPTEQTRKFDPHLKYIRQWIPEIDSFEYPQPMIEHSFARERALQTYKNGLNE